jgi:hypothetical protein
VRPFLRPFPLQKDNVCKLFRVVSSMKFSVCPSFGGRPQACRTSCGFPPADVGQQIGVNQTGSTVDQAANNRSTAAAMWNRRWS